MGTLKLNNVTAITESGGTVTLDSAVAGIPAAGVTGTLPNAVQDNITRLGTVTAGTLGSTITLHEELQLSGGKHGFSATGTSGWNTYTNEKVDCFNSIPSSDSCYNTGSNYSTGNQEYTIPVTGFWLFWLNHYAHLSATGVRIYHRVGGVNIPNQGDGLGGYQSDAQDTMRSGLWVFKFTDGDVIDLYCAGTGDVNAGASNWGGILLSPV
jgi:hypothetical protein